MAVPYALPEGWTFARWSGGELGTRTFRVLSPRQEVSSAPTALASAPEVIGETEVGATTDEGPRTEVTAAPKGPLAGAPVLSAADLAAITSGKLHPIEDPTGKALDPFYATLKKAEAKEPGAIARITYYGDSVILTDWITGTLRRKLQTRFGDSGHGFVLPADGWMGYHHDDITRFASSGWKVSRVVGPWSPDGIYGLGGVSFTGAPGSNSSFATTKSGDFGRNVSRFVLTYVETPGGGEISMSLDGGPAQIVPTAGDTLKAKSVTVTAPDGPHKLEVKNGGKGMIRLLGMVLERDTPGAVVDSIGILGGRLRMLDKSDDAHWAQMLKERNPTLVMFGYGVNESEDGYAYPIDQYDASSRAVIKQVREALPDAACLIVGPLDRAKGQMDFIPVLNKAQRSLAVDMGCGFFDTYAAMGGAGSMSTWMHKGLGGADFIHPTIMGGDIIAGWLYDAMMAGYEGYKAK